jgi:hypothetical protein
MSTAVAMMESAITRVEKASMTGAHHDEIAFSEMFMAYLLAASSRFAACC